MRVPISINLNTLQTYCNVLDTKKIHTHIQIDRFTSAGKQQPKNLQELCVESIADNWKDNPILNEIPLTVDRCLLLDILSTNLPLKLTIPNINDDFYWKRCYCERWPKLLPIGMNNIEIREVINVASKSTDCDEEIESPTKNGCKTWKECYLQMHARDYLEQLRPENYNPEEMKELSDLCNQYLKILNVRELQCSEDSPNRIPFNSVLAGFPHLTELSICFKQIYSGEKFSWNTLKVSLHDIKLLAKGLEKCNLKILRIVNSDIDDEKLIWITKALLKHDLITLDISHCKIADESAIALSKFAMENAVEEYILINNRIGSRGAEALAFALCQESCKLKYLNLKLNYLGEIGGGFLIASLIIGAKLVKLSLSGSGLSPKNRTIGEMLEKNSHLENFDLTNNKLGQEIGELILKSLQYNNIMKKLDVRMCQIEPEVEFKIFEIIQSNLKKKLTPKIIEPSGEFKVSKELRLEIENIFGFTQMKEENLKDQDEQAIEEDQDDEEDHEDRENENNRDGQVDENGEQNHNEHLEEDHSNI